MCYMPVPVKDPKTKKSILVPCGRCLECRKRLQNDWCIRITEDVRANGCKGVFFTLTYNDDSVPINLFEDGKVTPSEAGYRYKNLQPYNTQKIVHVWNDLDARGKKAFNEAHRGCPPEDAVAMYSVRKKDVQDWLKRFRKHLDKQHKTLRYFICSEYGPTTSRPHYHGVFIGLDRKDCLYAFQDWESRFGFTTKDNIDMSRGGIRYVSKYCSKGMYEHPFCSKDFFYWKKDDSPVVDADDYEHLRITEYHSKHYERSMEYFGIDEPIVERSFRLCSQSLGSQFLKDPERQKYFRFGEAELQFQALEVAEHNGRIYEDADVVNDSHKVRLLGTAYKKFALEDDPFEDGFDPDRDTAYFKSVLVKKGEKISNSTDFSKYGDIYIQLDLANEITTIINRNKYRFKNYGNETKKQSASFAYAMPRYYYTQMFGDTLRSAMSNIVLQVDVDLYNEQFREIRAADPDREDFEILLDMEKEKARQKRQRVYNAFRSANKQYSKSKL